MNNRQIWVIGFCVGLIVVCLVCIFAAIFRGSRQLKAKLDERQILARNVSYKYAFFGLLGYCIICALLDMLDIRWATTTALLFIGIFLSTTLFAILSILKDAYVPYNQEHKKSVIPWMISIGVLNLAVFLINVIQGENFFTDGLLNENVLNPCTAVMFLGIGTTQLIKNQINKKAAEDE